MNKEFLRNEKSLNPINEEKHKTYEKPGNYNVTNVLPKDVIDMLHFKDGKQVLDFAFYLCDNNDNILSKLDVTDSFTISHSTEATIKRTLELDIINLNVDLINKRIKAFVNIAGVEYPLGVFCIESPMKNIVNGFVTRQIKAYDKTVILQNDCLLENLYLPVGTLVTNAIEEVVNGSGIKRIDIIDSDKKLNRDYEFLIGTSRLEVINTLLEYINYTSINFTNDGYATAKPYTLPTNREVDFNYATNDISIIKPDRTVELDLFSVPNVFIATSSNSETESLTSIYINDNPNSKVSTVTRGRNIAKKFEVNDIVDQRTLDSYVRRLAYDYTTIYEKITFTTGVVPFHDNENCIYLDDHKAEIRDKFIETGWKIKKDEMEHNARKVVYI